jgi:hypothetical protein
MYAAGIPADRNTESQWCVGERTHPGAGGVADGAWRTGDMYRLRPCCGEATGLRQPKAVQDAPGRRYDRDSRSTQRWVVPAHPDGGVDEIDAAAVAAGWAA